MLSKRKNLLKANRIAVVSRTILQSHHQWASDLRIHTNSLKNLKIWDTTMILNLMSKFKMTFIQLLPWVEVKNYLFKNHKKWRQ